MDTLATIKDLDSYGIEYADEKLAGKLLESVSAAVRDAAGCPITRGEYTVTIPGETSRRLDLPMRPVISVSRVLMDGEQTGDWKLLGNALYRESLWSLPNMVPRSITVTMLAGYDPIPPDIVRLVCSMVAAGLVQQSNGGPGAHRDESYARIDDVQIGYRQGRLRDHRRTRTARGHETSPPQQVRHARHRHRGVPMNVQHILNRGRQLAESLMTDQCRVTHMGKPVTDPETGLVEPAANTVYEGKCKVQTSGGLAAENTEGGIVEALGAVTPVWSMYVHFLYGTTGLLPGDVCEITEADDPNLKGRKLRLLNMQSEKTHSTACRWNVKEVGNSNE